MSAKIKLRQDRAVRRRSVFVAMGAVVALGPAPCSAAARLETYLNESVQGLEVGAPVKYRACRSAT